MPDWINQDVLKVAIMALVIVGTVLGPLVERWLRKKAEAKQGEAPAAPQEPEASEPTLPYENVAQQFFAPYIERRRREYQERMAREAAPAEPAPVVEEEPTPPPAVPKREPVRPPPPAPSPPLPVAVRPSLEERLFRGRRWGAAARLVVASEILRRPRFPRRPRVG